MRFSKLANWKSTIPLTLLLVTALVGGVFFFNNRYNNEKWHIELFEAQHLVKYIYLPQLTPTYPDRVIDSEFNSFFFREGSVSPRSNKPDESAIEKELSRRVTQALGQLDLSIVQIPFLDIFPPVSVELAVPPKYVVISPRDRIKHADGYLVKQDLTSEQIDDLEKDIEMSGEHSAYAVRVSGIATYPALIDDNLSYQRTVFAVAHEWIHHYLAFFNLGRIYFSGGTAINETVADIAASEITDVVLRNHPTSDEPSEMLKGEPFDFKLLRDLRQDVDGLLLAQDLRVAEELMSTKRLAWCKEFNWCPRRINQAYLAWVDQYSARDGSQNIVGQQLKNIRLTTDSLHDFLVVVREIDSSESLSGIQREIVNSR